MTDAKGRFAETIVSTILEYAGYRVIRLGVEEMISEVKAAEARGEHALRLPEQLRVAPDFVVIDPRTGECRLLEVKFRRTLDEVVATELHARLTRQVASWPAMATAIVFANPLGANSPTRPDIRGHIGCLLADDLGRLVDREKSPKAYLQLRTLGGVFGAVGDVDLYRESEQLVAPIRAWA